MATWAELELAQPDMAARGRQLFYQFGPGLGFLATVRKDGGPRLHPLCPLITGGGIWLLVGPNGPKCADLQRDGRFALHAFTPEEVDDEFLLMGRAIEIDDAAQRATVVDAAHWPVAPEEVLFALDIERAMLAVYAYRGQWPPAYTTWRAPR